MTKKDKYATRRMPETDRCRGPKDRGVVFLENAIRNDGKFICEYCGDVTIEPTIDHYIPRKYEKDLIQLGYMTPDEYDPKWVPNLVLACPDCNRSKGGAFTRDLDLWEETGDEVADRIDAMSAARDTDSLIEIARVIWRISHRTKPRLEAILNYAVNQEVQ